MQEVSKSFKWGFRSVLRGSKAFQVKRVCGAFHARYSCFQGEFRGILGGFRQGLNDVSEEFEGFREQRVWRVFRKDSWEFQGAAEHFGRFTGRFMEFQKSLRGVSGALQEVTGRFRGYQGVWSSLDDVQKVLSGFKSVVVPLALEPTKPRTLFWNSLRTSMSPLLFLVYALEIP